MLSLYQRLGGPAAVNAAVDLFYDKVLADDLLFPFFVGMDVRRIKGHQRMFLTYAFGGFDTYTGRPLDEAHRHLVQKMALEGRHFDAVLRHLGATLAELQVAPELIAEAATIAGSVRELVLRG